MTAESSMRLLVAEGSPPETVMRPSGSHSMMAANPPGPGLPKQAPSVLMVTCVMAASPGLGGFAAEGRFPPFWFASTPLECLRGHKTPVLAVCGRGNGCFGVRSPPCRGMGSYGLGTGAGLSSPFSPGLAREAVRAYFSRGLGSPPGWGGAGRYAERFPVLLSGAGRPAPGGLASLPPSPGRMSGLPVFAVAFRRPSAGPAGRRLSGGSAPRTAGRVQGGGGHAGLPVGSEVCDVDVLPEHGVEPDSVQVRVLRDCPT